MLPRFGIHTCDSCILSAGAVLLLLLSLLLLFWLLSLLVVASGRGFRSASKEVYFPSTVSETGQNITKKRRTNTQQRRSHGHGRGHGLVRRRPYSLLSPVSIVQGSRREEVQCRSREAKRRIVLSEHRNNSRSASSVSHSPLATRQLRTKADVTADAITGVRNDAPADPNCTRPKTTSRVKHSESRKRANDNNDDDDYVEAALALKRIQMPKFTAPYVSPTVAGNNVKAAPRPMPVSRITSANNTCAASLLVLKRVMMPITTRISASPDSSAQIPTVRVAYF